MTPDRENDHSYLTTILSNMLEGVIAIDTSGRVLFVNSTLARLFDIGTNNVKGKHLLEVLRQNQLSSLLNNVLQDQRPRSEDVRTFAPEEKFFEAIAVPLIEHERLVGALLVLHDVTRVRRLEQVRRDFVANVSHEMRTPLASIKGFAETLRTGALNDPSVAMDFLTSIEKHTDNMTALVDDLLDLAAIESGQRTPVKEAVALSDLVTDVVKGLEPLAQKKKISVETNVNGSVAADHKQMKQILQNLLENAIKFNEEGGWVKISAQPHDGQIRITVADSGSGIPLQDIPRIFERFYRVDKARSRSLGGTGLGLAIVKHLTETNGGTIHVESSVGKGSIFTLLFPSANPPA